MLPAAADDLGLLEAQKSSQLKASNQLKHLTALVDDADEDAFVQALLVAGARGVELHGEFGGACQTSITDASSWHDAQSSLSILNRVMQIESDLGRGRHAAGDLARAAAQRGWPKALRELFKMPGGPAALREPAPAGLLAEQAGMGAVHLAAAIGNDECVLAIHDSFSSDWQNDEQIFGREADYQPLRATTGRLWTRGVDDESLDARGWTAAHWAAECGHPSTLTMIATLLRDPKALLVEDEAGRPPYCNLPCRTMNLRSDPAIAPFCLTYR